MNIVENIDKLKSEIPENVQLIAVSKTKPAKQITELYEAGNKVFGESKVQELMRKQEELPDDIEWHLIGHLQTNKIKYIVPFVHTIHSIDSKKLIKAVQKEAIKKNKVVRCLLQLHIAEEDTKYGFSEDEVIEILDSELFEQLKLNFKSGAGVQICGVMGMATYTDDEQQIRKEFSGLKKFYDMLKDKYFADEPSFEHISMGMTNDYHIAIEEGSTMVRVGSAIFGERNYCKK